MMEVQNAVITGTNLGMQHTDHGILSFHIFLDYGGSGQGFGGWVLDTNNPGHARDEPTRLPTTLASSLLLGIDEVFGCDWEKLKGISCRAWCEHSKVGAIGHFLKDKWLWMRHNGDDDYEFVVTSFKDINSA